MPLVEHPWTRCLCIVGAVAATGLLVGTATDSTDAWEIGAVRHARQLLAEECSGDHTCLAASGRRLETRQHNFQPAGEEQRHV